jgi:histidinol-phosphate aminotransferase
MARRARGHAVPVAGFGVEPLLAAVNERTRIIALCNPNDPTGQLLGTDALRALLEALPERVVVLLDEALRDYADAEPLDATLELLDDHPRLLVFRTFSKAWGLAGLRCGYAIGGPGAEPLLEQLAPELGVNELAQAGALEAVRTVSGAPRFHAAAVMEQRTRLQEGLAGLGLPSVASQANVVWVEPTGPHGGSELAHRLERAGIMVASGSRWQEPERVRVSVPHRSEHTDRLLRALGAE